MKNLIDIFKLRLEEYIENIEFDYTRNIDQNLIPLSTINKVRIKITGSFSFNTNWVYNPCYIKTKHIFTAHSFNKEIIINKKNMDLINLPKNLKIVDNKNNSEIIEETKIIGLKDFQIHYRKIFRCYLRQYSIAQKNEIIFEEI